MSCEAKSLFGNFDLKESREENIENANSRLGHLQKYWKCTFLKSRIENLHSERERQERLLEKVKNQSEGWSTYNFGWCRKIFNIRWKYFPHRKLIMIRWWKVEHWTVLKLMTVKIWTLAKNHEHDTFKSFATNLPDCHWHRWVKSLFNWHRLFIGLHLLLPSLVAYPTLGTLSAHCQALSAHAITAV